jgi:dienelactone hydrolase
VKGDDLRARLSNLLRFTGSEPPALHVHAERRCRGYVEQSISFMGGEGMVPALLLVPEEPNGGAVLVHHQHHSQWHLGKSEVAGSRGDRWQAFGPALAQRGVTVLAPDAPGFEENRPGPAARDSTPTDPDDYWRAAISRLLNGSLLMTAVLADAAAGHAVLTGLSGVDARRVGALGHSMGGASVLFHTALNRDVAFAAVSGAACTYRRRLADGTGIEAAQVVPGLLEIADIDEIAKLIAPRALLIVSSREDPYSRDAARIVEAIAPEYRRRGAHDALCHAHFEGGHSMTAERFAIIVDWIASHAGASDRGPGA